MLTEGITVSSMVAHKQYTNMAVIFQVRNWKGVTVVATKICKRI